MGSIPSPPQFSTIGKFSIKHLANESGGELRTNRLELAAAIGISASKFRALVEDGRMPSPRRVDDRSIWDVDELRAAFKALPHEGDCGKANSWADVV
jgi:hypothetical protein